MAVTLRFASDALLACRFAISPLYETMSAVRLLTRPSAGVHHAPWLRAVEPALERLDLTPLTLLTPHRSYGPDFLNPAPGTPNTTFETELAKLRATPAARVRREIDLCLRQRFGATPPPASHILMGRGDTARELCGDTLLAAWHALVQPWWPQIHQILEADIAYRSRLIADTGLAAALTDLHPRLTWSGRTLTVVVRSGEQLAVGADGIVLVPTAFGSLGVSYDPPSIAYPARGLGTLWATPAASPEPLAHLLGASRANILLHLDYPASTTGLAARCRLPLSSVSEHLAILRAAGLVSTHRTGRRLQHTRTPLGTQLIEYK